MSLTKVSYSMIQGAAVNVLDYGADLTGVVDSTSAIQAAINAGSGKTVYLPTGTYKISSTLTLVAGCSLLGDGYNYTTIYNATANSIGIVPNNDNEISNIKFTGTGSWSVAGRCVIESDPGATGTIGKRISVHDCYFDSTISTCAIGGNNLVDWHIYNNYVNLGAQSEHGFYLSAGSTRCWVQNNYLYKAASAITSCNAINCKGISSCWIENNFISGDGWNGYGICLSTVASNDVQIKNNRLYNLGTSTVGIRAGSASQDTNIYITGNDIYKGYFGIQLCAANSLVQNNYVEGTTYRGIELDGTAYDSYGMTVQGNKVFNCGGGIRIVDARNYSYILNNTVTSNTGNGINWASWYSGATIGQVVGNAVTNNSTNYQFDVAVPSDVGTAFTPTFTNLVETPGTGAVSKTGKYWLNGNFVNFEIKIAYSGTATSSSTGGSTYFAAPYGTPATYGCANVFCNQETPSTSNRGLATSSFSNISRFYTPTWAADGLELVITGSYSI